MKKKKLKIRLNVNTLIILVTIIISCFLVVKGFMYLPAYFANQKKAEELRTEKEYEEQKIKQIDEDKKNADTDENKEKIAREKLGMMGEDEVVFVDISGQE